MRPGEYVDMVAIAAMELVHYSLHILAAFQQSVMTDYANAVAKRGELTEIIFPSGARDNLQRRWREL